MALTNKTVLAPARPHPYRDTAWPSQRDFWEDEGPLPTHTHDGTGASSTVLFGSLDADPALAGGDFSVAGGDGAYAPGGYSTAIGPFTQARGDNSVAIGFPAFVGPGASGAPTGANSVAIGDAGAYGDECIAIGFSTFAGTNLVAGVTGVTSVGAKAEVRKNYSTAIGYQTFSNNVQSVALGKGATTTADNQIMLGTSAETVHFPGALKIPTGAGSGKVLTSDAAGVATWQTPSAGLASPLTTKGDVWGFSTVDARVPVGTNGDVLTADSTQALGIKWSTPSSGFADPTTTKGDLIVHGSTTTRMGVGTDGQVLTADSAQTLGMKWATPAGGGATYYSATSQTDTAVTDGASYYDINALSIASVPAGTYLAVVDIVGNNKSGEVRLQITDGSGTGLWPTGNNWDTRHNTDNNIEFHGSGVIVLGSTLTVKVRGAAVASVGNYHIYDRHLTLIKIA